ncbi:MAG: hypothetical protein RL885_22035 [Planctomycetota bacterium]
MRQLWLALSIAVLSSGSAFAQDDSITIYDTKGNAVSTTMEVPSIIGGDEEMSTAATTIDLWCCGMDQLAWSLNDTFFWATAFDTNSIPSTYRVTEVLWYADGGETDNFWIAPDLGGSPDTANAVPLGSKSIPASAFQWQSHDASAANALVDPGKIYWFIRQGQAGMTWQSTTNPSPPLQDPVQISQNFGSGWFPWVTGLNWHMEYEIRGEPCPATIEWDLEGTPTVGGAPVNFAARTGAAEVGNTALVFISLGNGSGGGLTVPASGGQQMLLDADGVFSLWLSLPTPLRVVTLTGCTGAPTAGVSIPPAAPTGLTVYYAGFSIDGAGQVPSVSATKSFVTQ